MVEWKKLGNLCEIKTGKGITQKDCTVDGVYPVISGGQCPMGMYSQYNREADTITISRVGAYAGFVSFIANRFYLNDKCFSIIPFKESLIINKFLFDVLKNQEEGIKKLQSEGGVPTINTKKLSALDIPIPPLSEQNRIVGILDTFTKSIENLKKQITERKKQYEHYRDQLLDFSKEDVEFKSIKEIVKSYCTGATPKKGNLKYYEGGTIPWLRTQDVKFNEIFEINSFVTNIALEETGIKWIPANCVIVAISGATAGRCAINKIPTTTNQHCLNLEIDSNKALYKYVYFCVYNAYSEMISKKQGARGDLNTTIILGIKIPIPSLQEQKRIVSILDTFEASITNLEAQLSLRQKQYEYYRNMLLTFDE